jgi:hypothetical protein
MHIEGVELKFVRPAGNIGDMKMHQVPRHRKSFGILLLLVAGPLLAECRLRDPSLADRCSDVMREAYPDAGIKVKKSQVVSDTAAASITDEIVQIDGVRPDIPAEGFIARDVAVECRFENGIMTNFRWTAGPFR